MGTLGNTPVLSWHSEVAAEVDPQRQLAEAAAEELLRTSEAHPINGDQPIELNASGMVVQRIIEMSASLPTSQLLWRITDVKHKIQAAKKETTVTIFSQAFYTAPHGYKLICATCPYGNKQGYHLTSFFPSFLLINTQVRPSHSKRQNYNTPPQSTMSFSCNYSYQILQFDEMLVLIH